jgi:predicted aspartyl protease
MIAHPSFASRDQNVGRFSVEFELTNYEDVVQNRTGHLPAEKVRRCRVSGVVDTGAARLVLPESAADEVGLCETGLIPVRYADGRREHRPLVADAQVEIQNRSGVFSAVVESGRTDALIGAIVLEELDLVADCTSQCLVPRDPEGPLTEIE